MQQPLRDAQLGKGKLGVNKKFHRIVARFAMDIYCTCKVRRARVVHPVVISEPRIFIRNRNEIASAAMARVIVEHRLHASRVFQKRFDFAVERVVIDVNMRHLMICYGKDLARTGIEQLVSQFFLDRQPALFAEESVEMDGFVHLRDSVFRKQHHVNAALCIKIQQSADDGVNGLQVGFDRFVLGAETLEVVIQMRKVNERQRGRMLTLDPFGRFGNPTTHAIGRALRSLDACRRAPKSGKRKRAQVAFNVLADFKRVRVNIKHLPAIRRVHRARREAPICTGIHVVPPKNFGACEVIVFRP